MALAVVGIQVKVGGISEATRQFAQLKASVDAVVASVKQLSNVKAPNIKNLTFVQKGGVGVFDQKSIDNSAKLNTGLTKVDNSYRKVTGSVTKLGAVTRTTTTSVSNMNKALSATGRVLTTGFGKAIQAAGSQLSAFGRRMTTFGSVLSTFGFRLTAFLTLPIVGALGGAIKEATLFEDALVSLITKVGIGSQVAVDFGDALLQIAPSLGADPVELLTAAYEPLSRGIRNTADALDILIVSAKASAIGLGEIEDIAKIVTAVMVAYGGAAGDAAKIGDILTSAIQFGSAEADEFVEPMGRAIGLASGLGVSFEELTAFMGTFAATGAPVTEVITGMNRVFATFVNPTEEAKDAFAAVGTSVEELVASIRENGLAATILELSRALEDVGIPLSDVYGRITGLNAVMFLSGNASKLYLDTLASIKEGAGSLDAAFQVVTESTSFQLEVFKSTIKSTAIVIGNILLPSVNKILAAITPLIAAIGEFAKLNPKVVLVATAFALLVATVGPLLTIAGLFVSSIGVLLAALGTLVSTIGAVIYLLTPLGAAFLVVAGAIGVIFVALKALASDFELTFTNIADNAVVWGQNIMIQLANGIARGIIYVVNQLTQLGRVFEYWLSASSPPNLLPDLVDWGANVINQFMLGFSKVDYSIFNDIADIFESFFRSLPTSALGETDLIPTILNSREIISAAVATGDLSSLLAELGPVFGGLTPVVEQYITTLFNLAAATEAVAAAQEEINNINEAFSQKVKPLNDELKSIADRFDEVKRAQEVEALNEILADPRAPELAKELAILQLRRLELEDQVGVAEEQRDTELEIANARLEAAKTEQENLQMQADLLKQSIDLQIEQNNLFKDQIDLLERLAKAAEAAAKAAAGAAGGAVGSGFSVPEKELPERGGKGSGKGIGTTRSLADIIGEGILGAGGELFAALERLAKAIQKPFEPLLGPGGLVARLAKVWQKVFDAVEALKSTDFKQIATSMFENFVLWARDVLYKKIPKVWASIKESLAQWAAREFFSGETGNIVDNILLGLAWLRDGLIGLFFWAVGGVILFLRSVDWLAVGQWVADRIVFGIGLLKESAIKFLNEWWPVIQSWFADIDWEAVGQTLADLIVLGIETLGDIVEIFFPGWKDDIHTWFNNIKWEEIPGELVNGIMDGMAKLSAEAINFYISWHQEAIDWFADIDWEALGHTVADAVLLALDSLIDFVVTFLPKWLGRIKLWFDTIDWYSIGYTVVTFVLEALNGVKDFVTVTLPEFWLDVKAWFLEKDWAELGRDLVEGIIDGVNNLKQSAINALISIAQGIVDAWNDFWENPRSPSPRTRRDGRNLALGYIAGINDMMPELKAAYGSASIVMSEAMMPASFAGASQGSSSQVFQIGPNSISNGMDDAIFAARVRQVVAGAIR